MNIVVVENEVIFKVYNHLLSERYCLKHFATWESFKNNYTPDVQDCVLICEISPKQMLDAPLFSHITLQSAHLKKLVISQNDEINFINAIVGHWTCEYLSKPFNNNELLVKVAQLIQPAKAQSIDICPITMQVSANGCKSESLTANEFRILNILLSSPDRAIDFEEVSLKFWSNKNSKQKLHTLLSRLRNKIEPLGFNVTAAAGSKVKLHRFEAS